jgi:DHA1 family tetracycline resistance protein-like MFS transporter
MNKIKTLVLITVFIDIVGLGIVIPILPFYVTSFGSSGPVVTLLFAIYALLAFFSAPFLGKLSDRIGRRPVLIASITSSALGWFAFAYAPNIIWLFIGRIIDGIAAGNIGAGQSALGDIAQTEQERAHNMGLIGAIFGIAFIIGPVLGGLLSHFGTHVPFVAVAIASLLNAIAAYFFFPETLVHKNEEEHSINPFSPIMTGLKDAQLRIILIAFFLFGVSISIQQSIFSLFASQVFGMGEKGVSLLFGLIGILILINQVFLLRKVWYSLASERSLTIYMLALCSIGIILSATPYKPLFFIALIVNTLGQSTTRATFMSTISGVHPKRRGEYIGIATSIMSLSMIVGPLLATVTQANIYLPLYVSGGIGLIGVVILAMYN